MKVIKKINNNVAICIDGNGKELIAFGNGIGFPKTPYEINDLSNITRTFYGVESRFFEQLNDLPEDIIEISAEIVDYAKTILPAELNSNLVVTLADHINFAIIRYQKKMYVKMPIMYDIKHLYPNEMKVGMDALRYINRTKDVRLSEEEAASIAMHFINAESVSRKNHGNAEDLISDVTAIIEEYFGIEIDRDGFNNSRFVSHMQYLLQREKTNQRILSDNERLFTTMEHEYPKTYECVLKVKDYLKRELDRDLCDEELLYLMLHINRLCSRENDAEDMGSQSSEKK